MRKPLQFKGLRIPSSVRLLHFDTFSNYRTFKLTQDESQVFPQAFVSGRDRCLAAPFYFPATTVAPRFPGCADPLKRRYQSAVR